jgi:glyoxylase-like metal-dependent hydrolase (beta-lactamase superfamily II)/predicted ester cyclase
MPTTAIVKRYFEALSAHDLDAATDCWVPGGVDRFVGAQELIAPDGVREYFATLFSAFPDFRMEIVEMTTYRHRTAVRWRAGGTFAGPGTFQGFLPNGARIEIEGCDVLTVSDDKIEHNEAYVDSGDIARQLGFLPPAGSPAEARLAKLANLRTRMARRVHGTEPRLIADGVWIVRGGFPLRTMNVYLIQGDDGLTMFDGGISDMTSAVRIAIGRLGGVERIVLGHVDADHRGAAPGIDAPVYCHPAERVAAESSSSFREYWDLSKLAVHGRALLSRLLPIWDGGALQVAGSVQEGDQVAGFDVVELPGHAPGLIGLFRESDRLALVSDCFYTLDPQTGIKGRARAPHPAFNADTDQARESIRKLAALDPRAAWAGHADPVTGDVAAQLERAASTPA